MNYMTEMFKAIKINVPQTKPMTYIWEYICNCSCHCYILIIKNCARLLASHCSQKSFKEPNKGGNSFIKQQCSPKNYCLLEVVGSKEWSKWHFKLICLKCGVKRHNITKAFVIHDRLTISPEKISYLTSWLIYLNGIKM
jgi:hypothetical protein